MTNEYPWHMRRLLAEQDVLALPFAEEYGGTGTGTLMLQVAVEELARASAAWRADPGWSRSSGRRSSASARPS